MDSGRFDALVRRIGVALTRRGALATLLAGVVASALPGSAPPDRAAARRGRRNGKGRDKSERRQRRRRKRKRRNGVALPPGRCCDRQACAPGPGKDLGRCCFQDRDLSAADFTGANLGGASFARARLRAATFRSANLDRTCFVDTDLTGVRFGGTNTGTAIFCRTEFSDRIDNSGCDRGTPCCPTCDATHPCGGEICCDGRCVRGDCCESGGQSTCGSGRICCDHTCRAGECCAAVDCPNEVCQRRACQDNRCVYTPVIGEAGPRCQTICCEDEQGVPVCCDAGVTTCQPDGVCGCAGDEDCGNGKVCCGGDCVPGTWVPLDTFGQTGPNAFNSPQGVAVSADGTTVWVTDAGSNRVSVWTESGGSWSLLTIFGSNGNGPLHFNGPVGVAVSTDEKTVWVADRFNFRVSVWTESGGTWAPLTVFGSEGSGPDEFTFPTDVAVSADEQTVWVADTESDRISVWTEAGGTWSNLTTFGSFGTGPNQFHGPEGVAVSADGRTVWVADTQNHRISIWAESGGTWSNVTSFGGFGSGPNQFIFPDDVVVSADEQTIWVADQFNFCISIWTKAGGAWTPLTAFGSEGAGPNQFRRPRAVSVSGDGQTAWVADALSPRVSVWGLVCPA